MKVQRKYVIIAACALAAAIAVFSRPWLRKADADEAGNPSLRPVSVALVARRPMESSITLSGEFRAFQQVDVHAKVAGYIRQIFVDVGDKVKVGQVLAILEVPELSAQVAGAKADIHRSHDAIHRAESEIERSKSGYAAFHAAYTRLEQASDARPGLIAAQELDDSLAKDKVAEAEVNSSQDALLEARSELSAAEAKLDQLAAMEAYSHITAPFNGVVTKRYADTGSLIQAGTASDTQAMPVVQLAEWSKLRLVVPVPESAVPELHLNSAVQVHVSALQRDFQGRVARFADALNDETRTMHTEIDVENPEGTLKEGMYAEVKLVLQQEENALTVPVQAVLQNSSGTSVLVVEADGRLQKREIRLGVEGSDHVEVVTGLAENDRVVIGGREGLHPGDKVQAKVVDASAGQPEATF